MDEEKQGLLEAKANLNSLNAREKEEEKAILRKPWLSELPEIESV